MAETVNHQASWCDIYKPTDNCQRLKHQLVINIKENLCGDRMLSVEKVYPWCFGQRYMRKGMIDVCKRCGVQSDCKERENHNGKKVIWIAKIRTFFAWCGITYKGKFVGFKKSETITFESDGFGKFNHVNMKDTKTELLNNLQTKLKENRYKRIGDMKISVYTTN